MTSKNLFSKLMREHTKQRLWTVALISVILFFAFPVQMALNISGSLDPNRLNNAADPVKALVEAQTQLGRYFMNWCSLNSPMMVFLIFLFAVVCGVSGYSYLHSKKKTDFYHSIPVRREQLFAVQYLNGFLYVAVPYLISMVIAAVMVSAKGAIGFSWAGVFKGYLMHMAFFLLLFSTVILAVVMTGNVIVSLLGTMVFFFWAPIVAALTQGYYQTYYETYYNNDSLFLDWCCRLSPAAWYIRAASEQHPEMMAVKGLIAAALIGLAAVVLYKKRPSEAAGRAMAFRISQPIIKICLVVPSALLGSLMFQSMMGKDSWSVFGLACGLLLSYCVIEIIYNFDFRRLFSHKKHLVLCGVISAAILAFFRFDLSGYDSYLPSESRLASAGIYCRVLDTDAQERYHSVPEMVRREDGSYRYVTWKYATVGELAEKMYLEDLAPVFEIAKQGVADADRRRQTHFNSGRYEGYSWMKGKFMREVVIAYHLNNGKTVFRSYNMDLTAVRDSLDAVYDQQSYKEAMYPVLSYAAEDIAGINYQEQNDYSHVALKDDSQKEAILAAYQKELSALTADVRRKESPVAALQFKTWEMQSMIDEIRALKADYTVFNEHLYFPIYPSFTETIRLLSECGTDVGAMVNENNVEKIILQYQGVLPSDLLENGDGELTRPDTAGKEAAEYVWQDWSDEKVRMGNPSVTITDKAQIREILDSTYSAVPSFTNDFNEEYSGVAVTAYVPYKPAWKAKEAGAGEADTVAEVNAGTGEAAAEAVYEYAGDRLEAEYTEASAEYYYEETVNDEVISDESYLTYSLRFDYDKVPEFVKTEFGLTEELMEYDKSKSY